MIWTGRRKIKRRLFGLLSIVWFVVALIISIHNGGHRNGRNPTYSFIVIPGVLGWYITPPRVTNEWYQISRLIVQCFDDHDANDNDIIDDNGGLRTLYWNIFGKNQLEQNIYRNYITKARKLEGSKYTILIAKDKEKVIGMAEVGIKIDKTILYNNNVTTSWSTAANHNLIQFPSHHRELYRERRPTIGLLCVHPEYQHQGVGRALVIQCERIIQNVWNETLIYTEVDLKNEKALSFFQGSCEYNPIPIFLSSQPYESKTVKTSSDNLILSENQDFQSLSPIEARRTTQQSRICTEMDLQKESVIVMVNARRYRQKTQTTTPTPHILLVKELSSLLE